MDDLEKESLTKLRVTDVYEDITSEKITCRQKTTKFTIKGNVIQSVLRGFWSHYGVVSKPISGHSFDFFENFF